LHLQKMRFGQMVRSDCGLRQLLNGNCRIGGDPDANPEFAFQALDSRLGDNAPNVNRTCERQDHQLSLSTSGA
jgi:hypothetical protein